MKKPVVRGKQVSFPVFLPDATLGAVRTVDSKDLQEAKIEGVVVNTYHLMTKPGFTIVDKIGGIHKFMDWDGLIASDSGGFQIFSMLHRRKLKGEITEKGIRFAYERKSGKRKIFFTPEKSIQVQFRLNSDIMICLDYFSPPDENEKNTRKSVDLTIEWAIRCKEEYLKQIKQSKISGKDKPKLFAVVQGGKYKNLREKCAKELLKIGFDGYGLGGWPFDNEGNFDSEIVAYTASLTPDDLPRFALGVGNPKAVVDAFKSGYHIFDCVLPTRDARHKRLYVFNKDPNTTNFLYEKDFFGYMYIDKEKYTSDPRPISKFCDCRTCCNYSRAYLNHLFNIEESLAGRLATIHNLRTYMLLIENLRKYGR